jgi:hypothetical protein
VKFECTDCETVVFSAGVSRNPDRRCAGCQILADTPDMATREKLRAAFARRGIIGTPRPRAGATEAVIDVVPAAK